ncbi:MAG: LuxR C-terminal-related transcriptional regulator [Brooklawnia sp.]
MTAAWLVIDSALPGHARPPKRAIDVVTNASAPVVRRLTPDELVTYLTARLRIMIRNGASADAADLVTKRFTAAIGDAAAEATADGLAAGHAVIAEVFSFNGHLAEAATAIRAAVDYAERDEYKFCAIGLRAMIEALNGEFVATRRSLEEAAALDAGKGWSRDYWPVIFACSQLGGGDSPDDALESYAARLDDWHDSTVLERILSRLMSASMNMKKGDHRAALAEAQLVARSVETQPCPPLFAGKAISLEAGSLIMLGEVGPAIKLLNEHESLPNHAICLELFLAGIHLLMGEPRKALAATEKCVRDVPNHSLRTFPSVLLRRAVAHEQLGHEARADANFSRASHMASEIGGVRPAMGLPLDILGRLLHRLVENEPEFGKKILARIPLDGEYPDAPQLDFEPVHLSERELVLAKWLITDLTLAAIAAELHVSLNTVKTQTRSIYRKLEVTCREEAVHKLEATGVLNLPEAARD